MFKFDDKTLQGNVVYQETNNLLSDTDFNLLSYAETMGWITIRLTDVSKKNWKKTMHFLQENKKIKVVQPNNRLYHGSQSIPDDTHFGEQWNLYNDGTVSQSAVAGADINALAAWDITTGNHNVVAAIFDLGIDLDSNGNLHHPDLSNNNNHILGKSTQPPLDVKDNHGHGTWVSGVIFAEKNNAEGIAGLAPDIKGHHFKATWNSEVVDATDYLVGTALQNYPDRKYVVNLSSGLCLEDDEVAENPYKDAVQLLHDNDVTLVTITHNDTPNRPFLQKCYPQITAPGIYSLEYNNVITVGATTEADQWRDTNRWGPEVTLVAPGRIIPTTARVGGVYDGEGLGGLDGPYRTSGQSSIAAPHVTGTVGLMLSINNDLKPNEIRDILIETAEKVGDEPDSISYDNGFSEHMGFGRVNAFKAVYKAMQLQTDELAQNLKSLDGDALAATNSANIIDDEDSNIWHHGVFSSGNDIYYFRRRPWTTDQITRLTNKNINYSTISSEALAKHSHPSITQIDGKLHAVWQMSSYFYPSNAILYAYSDDGGATWSEMQQVFSESPTVSPKPAITSIETDSDKLMMVVINTDYGLRYYTYDFNSNSWDSGGDVPQTLPGDNRPTISANVNIYGQPRIHLSYARGGAIYYNSYTETNGWSQYENISSIADGGNYTHKTPVISSPLSNTQRHIAWHRQQGSGSGAYDNVIIHRRGNEWNWFSEFYTVYYQLQELPSISALANGEADLLFRYSQGNLIYHQRFVYGSYGWTWTLPNQVGSSGSVYPAVSQSGSANHMLWTRYNSAQQAYEIKRHGSINQKIKAGDNIAGFEDPQSNHFEYYSRGIVMTDTTDAYVRVNIYEVQLTSDYDHFYPAFQAVGLDTFNLRTDNMDKVLRLSTHGLTKGSQTLDIKHSVEVFNPEKIIKNIHEPRIQINHDDESFYLPLELSGSMENNSPIISSSFPISVTESTRLGIAINGIEFTKDTKTYLNHIYNYVNEERRNEKVIEVQPLATKQEMQDKLSLSNYPNPFNPNTNIHYTLPERSHVTLTVYDVMGRRIVTLVDNVQDESTYQVTFDATGLASGLYIYRLQTPQKMITHQMMFVK